MSLRSFKTIVFFGENFSVYEGVKEYFRTVDSVKTFRVQSSEELEQILKQSTLAAVVIQDENSLATVSRLQVFNNVEANLRSFYLNFDDSLSRAQIKNFSERSVTTLNRTEDVQAKVEMYLLSKLSFGDDPSEVNSKTNGKRVYFAHLRERDNVWSMVASSHEKDNHIETRFGQSWTLYCMDLIEKASEVNERHTNSDFSPEYMEILFPHPATSKGRALSIMHIKKDLYNFDQVLGQAFTFLQNI